MRESEKLKNTPFLRMKVCSSGTTLASEKHPICRGDQGQRRNERRKHQEWELSHRTHPSPGKAEKAAV